MSEKGSLKANESAELGSSSSSSAANGDGDQMQNVDDASEMEGSTAYEGVPASDFTEFASMVEMRLDALTASSVVVVFALFICTGIIGVQTFIRSLELWNS